MSEQMIRAFQAGREMRLQREQHALDESDRALNRNVLEMELRRMKDQDKIQQAQAARNEQLENIQLLKGQDESLLSDQIPGRDLSSVLMGMQDAPGARPAQQGPFQQHPAGGLVAAPAAAVPVAANQPLETRTVVVPSATGGADISVQPQSLQQLDQRAADVEAQARRARLDEFRQEAGITASFETPTLARTYLQQLRDGDTGGAALTLRAIQSGQPADTLDEQRLRAAQAELAEVNVEIREEELRKLMNPPAGAPSMLKMESRGRITSQVDQILAKASSTTTGRSGTLARMLGSTNAAELDSLIQTLEANLAFNELQKMRDASKTGGALGSIAVRELDLLGSVLGSLNTKQGLPAFKNSLQQIKKNVERWNAIEAMSPQQQTAFAGMTPEQQDEAISLTGVLDLNADVNAAAVPTMPPDGTTGTLNGDPVVVRGGEWVRQ